MEFNVDQLEPVVRLHVEIAKIEILSNLLALAFFASKLTAEEIHRANALNRKIEKLRHQINAQYKFPESEQPNEILLADLLRWKMEFDDLWHQAKRHGLPLI